MSAAALMPIPSQADIDEAPWSRPPTWPIQARKTRLTSLLRPAPQNEPPYDDEVPAAQLHLVSGLADELPFAEPAPRQFSYDIDLFDPQPTSRRNLSDPNLWSRRLIQGLIEASIGRRPVAQLRQWTNTTVFAFILSLIDTPGRFAVDSTAHCIQSIHVSEPADGVAEICAVIRCIQRHLAIAARLEGIDGRWQCVELSFV